MTIPIRWVLVLALTFFQVASLYADAPLKSFQSHYHSALLIDANTGQVLYEENANAPRSPASLSKMMVALIALEYESQGKIHWDDLVTTSRWVSKIGGAQVYLKEGEVFELQELMKAMIVMSANDATSAIAEHISGSQKAFVALMNDYAQRLEMYQTRFYNPHGLPPGWKQHDNVSSAHDLAILADALLKHPQYLKWSSIQLDSFRDGTFQLLNTNRKLLRKVVGMDGLKTGYHSRAGFNLVSTAKRPEGRLISVVLGGKTPEMRNNITQRLLEWGFQKLQTPPSDWDVVNVNH